MKKKKTLYFALLIVILIGIIGYITYSSLISKPAQISGPKAPLVMISSEPLLQNNNSFITGVKNYYDLVYAGPDNYSSFLNYSFVILYVNSSSNDIISRLGRSLLTNNSISPSAYSNGFSFYFRNVWAKNQEVYLILNMNSSAVAKILGSFISMPKVYAPNAQTLANAAVTNFTKDPFLDGIYIGGYQCPYGCPLDQFTNLPPPLNYYVDFSYAFYFSNDGFYTGGGDNLPTSVGYCTPPTPGACVAVYVGAPVFQVNYKNLVTPLLGLYNVNVSTTLGVESGVEGTATEGSFLITDFSFSPSTNETITYLGMPLKQMIKNGVTMYSSPLYPLPLFDWVYGLYPLVQVTSNIGNISGLTPTNYTNLFYPIRLTAPQQISNSSGTWTFSAWSIYEEIRNNTYYQTFNYPTMPFYVQGPIQATAIYNYQAPPHPGSISGYVEYAYSIYNSYLNITRLGPPISNVSVLFYNNGKLIANATSNSNGFYTTPTLQEGCYNVSISTPAYYQNGLNIYAEYTPVCVYNDVTFNLYEFAFPGMYVYTSSNPFNSQVTMPLGQTAQMLLDMFWPDGKPAVGFDVSSSTPFGSVNTGTTNASGIAQVYWTAGNTPGFYRINFSRSLGGYLINSSVNANAIALNISSQKAPIQATNDSNISLAINVSFPGSEGVDFPDSVLNTNLSISGLPSGATASFVPNPVPFYTHPVLLLNIGKTVKTGLYNLQITATDNGPGYWSYPLSAHYNMQLNVSSCINGLGGISGQVLNRDANPTASNLTIANRSGIVYRVNAANGVFNTGYILEPGQYNVSAYISSNLYVSRLIDVRYCSISNAIMSVDGGLTVEALLYGRPVSGANITLTGPAYFKQTKLTSTAGQAFWGYVLQKGYYEVNATYGGVYSIYNVSITPSVITNLNVSV